jgi:hypothetical protein
MSDKFKYKLLHSIFAMRICNAKVKKVWGLINRLAKNPPLKEIKNNKNPNRVRKKNVVLMCRISSLRIPIHIYRSFSALKTILFSSLNTVLYLSSPYKRGASLMCIPSLF